MADSPNQIHTQGMGVEESEKSWDGPGGASGMQTHDGVAKEHGTVLGAGQVGSQATDVVAGKKADVAPNGGYGWVCVAACATINGYVDAKLAV
jgi:hypothetical protein